MKQIVSRKIKARNPITGEFEGINVFAAESTEEYLAKIQKKGEDTLSAVGAEMDAHGQRVLKSLPEEYTNLVVQTTGESETQVMSQKAATTVLNSIGYANLIKGVDAKTVDVTGENLISGFTDGKYIAASGIATDSASLSIADADVIGGNWYGINLFSSPQFSGGSYTAFLTSNGYINGNETTRQYIVIDEAQKFYGVYVPEGVIKLRFNINISQKESAVCKLLKTKFKIPWIDTAIEDESVTFHKINKSLVASLSPGNYVKIEKFRDNYYVSGAGENSFNFEPPISIAYANIEGGKTYIITLFTNPFEYTPNGSFASFFNGDKYVGEGEIIGVYNRHENLYIITAPETATAIRFNVNTSTKDIVVCAECDLYHEIPWLKVNKEQITDLKIYKKDIVDFSVHKDEVAGLTEVYPHSVAKGFDFTNKKIVAFGDSITVGATPGFTPSVVTPYIKRFADAHNATLDNRAVSGSFICQMSGYGWITEKVLAYTGDADAIFIAGGCNDYNFGAEIGEYGDTDNGSFYACLRTICTHLSANCPNAKVYFITPINQSRNATGGGTYDISLYRNAIFEVATSFGFNVVDGSKMGFPTKWGDYAFKSEMIYDGVHPTEKGHIMYANSLSGVIV